MRTAIFKILTSGFGLDLSTEMPYHVTLTIFWMRTIADFNRAKNGEPLLDKVNELASLYDNDYRLNYYSREFLFSDEARTRFVEGNL